jgi:ComF family protein
MKNQPCLTRQKRSHDLPIFECLEKPILTLILQCFQKLKNSTPLAKICRREDMWIVKQLSENLRDAYDILVPPGCPVCQRTSSSNKLCSLCLPLPLVDANHHPCLLCGDPLPRLLHQLVCPACHSKPLTFHWIRSLYLYDGHFRRTLHSIKYNGCAHLLPQLIRSHKPAWSELIPIQSPDVIVPIPANSKNYRRRGFDQALLIAKLIRAEAGWSCPIRPSLLKVTRTSEPQSSVARSRRRANTTGLYTCSGSAAGLNILLVDDLWTSGSTIYSASACLTASGAKSISVLTLARTGDWDKGFR